MEYARRLRDDRGKGNIVVVEDGDESSASMGDDEFAVSHMGDDEFAVSHVGEDEFAVSRMKH